MKPHTPLFPPRKWAEMYPIEKETLPPVGNIETYPKHVQSRILWHQKLPEKGRRAHRAGYHGNLAFVDTCIGYLYDALREMGLEENTIVVYTSDHGEMDGDHGLFQKFCLFEPAVAVPLIVSYPKQIAQGKVASALSEYIGLYPTLCDLVGFNAPRMDATSFADILRNPDKPGPEAAFSENDLRSPLPQYMARTRRYKYIFNHGAMHELYDMEADPGEFANRINDPGMQKVVTEHRDRLLAWYNPEKNPYRPTPVLR
jgi:choline-sulfatase